MKEFATLSEVDENRLDYKRMAQTLIGVQMDAHIEDYRIIQRR